MNIPIAMRRDLFCLALVSLFLSACVEKVAGDSTKVVESDEYPQQVYDYLAIANPAKLSAASKRALERGYYQHAEWFGEFYQSDVSGDLAFEEGVTRRDPSKVLLVQDTYYTWYSKTIGPGYGFGTGDPEKKVFPWDKTDIWYATSKDGKHWEEQGMAIGRGVPGSYDDRSVFTPEVLAHDGRYYLVYQTIKAPYLNRSKNEVGLAYSNNPYGPWVKLENPILKPADNGVWLGEQDNRFLALQQGDFDSHKVHDPTLMFYQNKFYLYYKGERFGEKVTAGGREIRWGVAIADKIEGPYVKSEYNPITHSGHELAIWHYKGGIAMVSGLDGPEKGTIQYAKDGINFEIMSYVSNVPHAMGLVESLDNDSHPRAALSWGLSHATYVPKGKSWIEGFNYMKRFVFVPRKGGDEFIHEAQKTRGQQ